MLSLVDFGAVAAANPARTMGSTIIGTYGYALSTPPVEGKGNALLR